MARNHKNSHKNFYLRFESSVIHKGTKTRYKWKLVSVLFESSVIHKGTKTYTYYSNEIWWFESSVIHKGTKTKQYILREKICLRVV